MIKVVLSLLLFVSFGYTSYRTVEPLFLPIDQIENILFSHFALPFIAVWGIGVFSGVSLIASFKCLIKQHKYKGTMRTLYLSLLLGVMIGVSVNYANYYGVIKPNNMLECPAKAGYKKNLMSKYVTDITACEMH
ncbi:hypothetical protein AB6D11_01070 [Vibrio splendidus]